MGEGAVIPKEVVKQISIWCKKPKKFCAMCDSKLGKPSEADLQRFPERLWCSWVSFSHPIFKSKTYRVCGTCYGEILAREAK